MENAAPSNQPPGRKGFTNEWIRGLVTLAVRREYSDTSGAHPYSLHLRLRHEANTGRKTWGLWLTVEGKRTWVRLGGVNVGEPEARLTMTIKQALDWTKDVVEAARNGNLKAVLADLDARNAPLAAPIIVPAMPARTVRMAFETPLLGFYDARICSGRKKRRRPEDVKRDFDSIILPVIGHLSCLDPEIEGLCRVMVAKLAKKAPVRAGHILGLLKQFFAWAARGDWTKGPDGQKRRSPVEDLMPDDLGVEKAEQRDRALEDQELRDTWEAVLAQKPYGHKARISGLALRFLMVVPVRTHSLLLAERKEIDWENRRWAIPVEHLKLTTEGIRKRKGQPLVLPLSPLALHILREMFVSGGTSRWIAASPKSRTTGKDTHLTEKVLARGLARMIRRGELRPAGGRFTPHDLRRTLRTRMHALGLDRTVAENCLGHVTAGKVEETYDVTRLARVIAHAEEMRETLETVSRHIEEVVGFHPPPTIPVQAAS